MTTVPIGSGKTISEAERRASLGRLLAGWKATEPLWVFAYGSLLWRPAFWPAEEQIARVYGWHRRLDIHAIADRGTPATPGLWFGLAPGGSTWGVAMRLPMAGRQQILTKLWRREMPDDAYAPQWLTCHLPHGRVIRALAFVTNRASGLYAGDLASAEITRRIASAEGPAGSARCYVMRTQVALNRLGIRDDKLAAMARLLQSRHGTCQAVVCAA